MKDLLNTAYDPEAFRRAGHALIDLLADHMGQMATRPEQPVIDWQQPEAARAYWHAYEADADKPEQLFADILKNSIHLHHPRYMGHQISVPAPMAALTSLLDAALNNGMGVYEMGQAGTAIEKVVVDVFNKTIGFGEASDGFLTSGGTLANLTALLCARQLKSNGDVWTEGLKERTAILVSEEAHYCVDRAVRIMGMGSEGIVKVPVDDRYKIRVEQLEQCYQQALTKGLRVIALVGSAPSTSTGAYDDLEALADFAEQHQLWFHVDGAHGGAAIFSAKYKHLLKGIERADSVAIDCHKMLMTPSVATALLFRKGQDAYATFSQKAQYLWARSKQEEWHNLARRTFECTKLMMSLRFYTLYKMYGLAVFEQFVDTLYDSGRQFAKLIVAASDFEGAVEQPDANIVCFRYIPEGDLSDEQTNELNRHIRQQLLEDGRFYIVSTQLRGKQYLRVALMNPFSKPSDFEELLSCIRMVVSKLLENA
ncbi:MAG: aminotransferase class I/II-fold pyridoxal phosphate-dependent enzyme [Bacteroidota bacterium]